MTQAQAKKVLPILLISIPFLVLILAILLIYAPYLYTAKPKYDFIYTDSSNYSNCADTYFVENRTIKKRLDSYDYCRTRESRAIYYHDVLNNRSKPITFVEAEKFSLDSSNKSEDGFILESKYRSSGGFLFSYSSGSDMVLVKDSVSFPQDLEIDEYRVVFLGWVLK